jgi:hypothetical protein
MRKFGWSIAVGALLAATAAASDPASLYGPAPCPTCGPDGKPFVCASAPTGGLKNRLAGTAHAGDCSTCAAPSEHQHPGLLSRLLNWVCYRPCPNCCPLPQPEPYHPPLYTYFDCHDKPCATPACPTCGPKHGPLLAHKCPRCGSAVQGAACTACGANCQAPNPAPAPANPASAGALATAQPPAPKEVGPPAPTTPVQQTTATAPPATLPAYPPPAQPTTPIVPVQKPMSYMVPSLDKVPLETLGLPPGSPRPTSQYNVPAPR